MQVIALGKVTAATAGTPTPITAAMITAAGGALPPNGGVARIEVWADPAMAGTTAYVKTGGTVIAALPKPSGGFVAHWDAKAPAGGNDIIPTQFAIDVATNGDGAYVSVWID